MKAPKIDLKAVKSSAIKAHGYDPATRTLRIEFHSGAVYDYAGVTPETQEAFAAAESFGKHFMSHIRTGHKSTRIYA